MSIARAIVIVLALAILVSASASAAKPRRQRGAQNQPTGRASSLDEQTQKAILAALEDERKAKAFYKAVIAKHGEIRPFSNIVEAEARHESALVALAEKYNIKVPDDPWTSKTIDLPETLTAATEQAIKNERENVAMYDGFLKTIQQEDIRNVMTQLRWASQERHLPALERQAGGRPGRGPGVGWQGGNRRGGGGCCPACCDAGGPPAQEGGTAINAGQGNGPGAGWQGGRGAGRGPGGAGGGGHGWHGGRDR